MEKQFNDLSVPDPNISYQCDNLHVSRGFTHLMKLILMVNKHPDAMPIIRSLLKNSDEINKQNTLGWTALSIACGNITLFDDITIIKMLINAGADVNISKEYPPMMSLLKNLYNHNLSKNDRTNILSAVKLILNSNYDRNCQRYCRRTPLMVAVIRDFEMFKIFIDIEPNINRQDNCDFTALIFAVCSNDNNVEMVKMLIDSGSDVNISNVNYNTALSFACRKTAISDNDFEIIKLLLDAGSNINHRNDEGNTPLLLSRSIRVINLLMDYGADVNIKNYKNRTILMTLLKKNIIESDTIIRLIYQSGKSLLDNDKKHGSAYFYYIENGYTFLDEHQEKLLRGDVVQNRHVLVNYTYIINQKLLTFL